MNSFRHFADTNIDYMLCNDYSKNRYLIEEKLNYLLSLPSPYVVKNNILFLRGTDKLVSRKFKILVQDTKGKIQYFYTISECSVNLNIPRKIIKESLISGNQYKNYIFKYDTFIK